MAHLLLSYFLAIQFIVVPLSQHHFRLQWPRPSDGSKSEVLGGLIDQGERIMAALPQVMQPFTWWQKDVINTAKAEIDDLDPTGPKVLRLKEFAIA